MKKMENELKNIIKTMSGNVLLIGNYSNKLECEIIKNEQILACDQLTNNSSYNSNEKSKNKKINIKNLKKYYKKKNIKNTIVNFEDVKEYKNTFIKDSSYITKSQIIVIDKIYNNSIYKMYKRYCSDIKIIDCLDGRIIKINSSNSKKYIIRNIVYYIIDELTDILNIISNLL